MSKQGVPFLERRSFLKKLGAASVGSLAFGPLVMASRAMAETGVKPRLLMIHFGHGLGGPGMATGTTDNFTLAPRFSPLNDIKEHLTLIDGLFGTWWGNAHNVSYVHMYTGSSDPNNASTFSAPRSPSIDYLIEQKLGRGILPTVRFSSGGNNKLFCFDKNLQPLVYQSLANLNKSILNNIGGVKTSDQKQQFLNAKRKKLLDDLAGDLRILKGRINADEQIKLEYQLESIQTASSNLGLSKRAEVGGACTKPQAYSNKLSGGDRYNRFLDLSFEHIKILFACNLTQMCMFTAGSVHQDAFEWKDSAGRIQKGISKFCTEEGRKDFHQCLAHYKSAEERLVYEASITHFLTKLTNFCKQLDTIQEPNGKSLLENTMIVVNGEVGDGGHDRNRKPVLVIGGRGAPGLKTGRYIRVPQQQGWNITTPDGQINLGRTRQISMRTEADLLREVAEVMGLKLKTVGSPYLNRGRIGLM